MKSGKPAALVPLALALLVAVAPPVYSAEADNLLGGYSLTSWTDGDGVPLGTVYSIGQDRDGYLWIATDAGLLRFDGVRFTPWDSIGETPLPKGPVSALWVARDGKPLDRIRRRRGPPDPWRPCAARGSATRVPWLGHRSG